MMKTGCLLFRAEGEDISGFLTLAADYDLTIQKFCKADGICFGYLPPREYRTAARLARSVGVRLQILEKNGVSFALRRYRRRLGLLLWPILFTGLLLFSQCFLWAVDVTGCEKMQPETIRQAAAGLGLKQGIFLPAADLAAITTRLRQDFPTIASLSLNRVGSRVEIALTEATLSPPILPEDPCNLVAARTGRITSLSVTRGQSAVKLGQTIAEGQLLISGITETPDGKIAYDHASGQVLAETSFQKAFTLQLKQQEKQFDQVEKQCRYLDLFGKKLPLFLPDGLLRRLTGKEEQLYESSRTLEPLTVLGIELPLGVETETRAYYTLREKVFTEESALRELEEAAADFEQHELQDAQILTRESAASVSEGVMTLTLSYTCIEDIARERAIEIVP
ncbi:MAG: sporulation protein YqfD [Oscillospiraceae bacterium]|nr:sporulation protein YqfD [Oscillospiraceae bacterium]